MPQEQLDIQQYEASESNSTTARKEKQEQTILTGNLPLQAATDPSREIPPIEYSDRRAGSANSTSDRRREEAQHFLDSTEPPRSIAAGEGSREPPYGAYIGSAPHRPRRPRRRAVGPGGAQSRRTTAEKATGEPGVGGPVTAAERRGYRRGHGGGGVGLGFPRRRGKGARWMEPGRGEARRDESSGSKGPGAWDPHVGEGKSHAAGGNRRAGLSIKPSWTVACGTVEVLHNEIITIIIRINNVNC